MPISIIIGPRLLGYAVAGLVVNDGGQDSDPVLCSVDVMKIVCPLMRVHHKHLVIVAEEIQVDWKL